MTTLSPDSITQVSTSHGTRSQECSIKRKIELEKDESSHSSSGSSLDSNETFVQNDVSSVKDENNEEINKREDNNNSPSSIETTEPAKCIFCTELESNCPEKQFGPFCTAEGYNYILDAGDGANFKGLKNAFVHAYDTIYRVNYYFKKDKTLRKKPCYKMPPPCLWNRSFKDLTDVFMDDLRTKAEHEASRSFIKFNNKKRRRNFNN